MITIGRKSMGVLTKIEREVIDFNDLWPQILDSQLYLNKLNFKYFFVLPQSLSVTSHLSFNLKVIKTGFILKEILRKIERKVYAFY